MIRFKYNLIQYAKMERICTAAKYSSKEHTSKGIIINTFRCLQGVEVRKALEVIQAYLEREDILLKIKKGCLIHGFCCKHALENMCMLSDVIVRCFLLFADRITVEFFRAGLMESMASSFLFDFKKHATTEQDLPPYLPILGDIVKSNHVFRISHSITRETE